jgi:hypothetical protein
MSENETRDRVQLRAERAEAQVAALRSALERTLGNWRRLVAAASASADARDGLSDERALRQHAETVRNRIIDLESALASVMPSGQATYHSAASPVADPTAPTVEDVIAATIHRHRLRSVSGGTATGSTWACECGESYRTRGTRDWAAGLHSRHVAAAVVAAVCATSPDAWRVTP